MGKTIKILCLATTMFFVLAGVGFATPIASTETFEYFNPDGELGARVYFDIQTTGDGQYRYIYQVENVAFSPLGDGALHPIYTFLLPVTEPVVIGQLSHEHPHVGINLSHYSEAGVDYVLAEFWDPGLLASSDPSNAEFALSDPFFIESSIGLDWGNSVLTNGTSVDLLVLSNLNTSGEENDEPGQVPEPATLLLVGIGALGIEGLRRFKSRRA